MKIEFKKCCDYQLITFSTDFDQKKTIRYIGCCECGTAVKYDDMDKLSDVAGIFNVLVGI